MSLIVQKFGGTSVANRKLIFNAARIITEAYDAGNDVVVVVSAQGDMTDQLIFRANEINKKGSKREMDMLLSAGEQISVALMAMALESMNYPVVSLLGWQAGVMTTSTYGSALITKIDISRVRKELDKRNIVVIAGFQGLNKYYDVTTLGRGGSDTTAIGIAATLNADICRIYTDVDGVYTADPRKVKTARKLSCISYDEMLELANMGAQVLNNRSVEIAKKHNVEVEVLSSLRDVPGTTVKEVNVNMEKMLIRGVAKDDGIARVTVSGIPDCPGWAFKIFSKLSSKNINVDIILQSTGEKDKKDISFTVREEQLEDAVDILKDYCSMIAGSAVSFDKHVSKVSIVGAGMESHLGVAAKMFESLFTAQINIQMIATSEIKISVLLDQDDADKAVVVIHDAFFDTPAI